MQTLINQDLQLAKKLLEVDELVAIPTETVYGLAGNALSTTALLKIFSTKDRPVFNPLIVHTHSLEEVCKLTQDIPEAAKKLMENFWPGPLTLLLPKKRFIPDLVTAGSPLVAIRIPHHSLTLQLLQTLDFPLAAPSANLFGRISPTHSSHVFHQLSGKIPLILEGGEPAVGIESTIIGFEGEVPLLYRFGGIAKEAIEECLGKMITFPQHTLHLHAPGRLTSHYAPKKPLYVGDIRALAAELPHKKKVALAFQHPIDAIPTALLSPIASLPEAAKNLFSLLTQLDQSDADCILAEWVPDEGLGCAINDRLRRASFK